MNDSKCVSLSLTELTDKIQSGKLRICVIGIGRIGLPTALSFADSGLSTIGVDINQNLVDKINSGNFPLMDEPGYYTIFKKVLKEKKFSATSNLQEALSVCDVVLLSLPTPMDSDNIPDYSALRSVGKQLHDMMAFDTLVVVESTIEPGFVENDLIKIIEGNDGKFLLGKNFGIGVCPETANPGQILNDFERLPRLVAGTDEKTKNIIQKIYKHVFTVDLIPMPNCKTANAVKLTTNVFRDLNIAFVNELAVVCEKAGIDILTVLNAAKTKYNFQVHFPGAGVGGPCLPVNSYQMINFAKNCGLSTFNLVSEGRKINENMPNHTVNLLEDALKQCNVDLISSSILILGASYKPDVKDFQISPAEDIINILKNKVKEIKIYDPYFKNSTIFGIETSSDLSSVLSSSDALVIVTSHKEFHDLDPHFLKSKLRTPIVIDSRCLLEPSKAEKAGLVYRGIGRGK